MPGERRRQAKRVPVLWELSWSTWVSLRRGPLLEGHPLPLRSSPKEVDGSGPIPSSPASKCSLKESGPLQGPRGPTGLLCPASSLPREPSSAPSCGPLGLLSLLMVPHPTPPHPRQHSEQEPRRLEAKSGENECHGRVGRKSPQGGLVREFWGPSLKP